MKLQPDFQASASRETLTFQVEHLTFNTRLSIETNGRRFMNFSRSCRITESINLKMLRVMVVINKDKKKYKVSCMNLMVSEQF
jgi:hypothetical protein